LKGKKELNWQKTVCSCCKKKEIYNVIDGIIREKLLSNTSGLKSRSKKDDCNNLCFRKSTSKISDANTNILSKDHLQSFLRDYREIPMEVILDTICAQYISFQLGQVMIPASSFSLNFLANGNTWAQGHKNQPEVIKQQSKVHQQYTEFFVPRQI
jgi:hypothetical protein